MIVDNAGKFSLINNNPSFLVPRDGLASSSQNPPSPPVNGSKLPVCNPSQDTCMHNIESPENVVLINEAVGHLDIIESMAQHQVGALCDNVSSSSSSFEKSTLKVNLFVPFGHFGHMVSARDT